MKTKYADSQRGAARGKIVRASIFACNVIGDIYCSAELFGFPTPLRGSKVRRNVSSHLDEPEAFISLSAGSRRFSAIQWSVLALPWC